jgi:microcystin degradation protein MlrC
LVNVGRALAVARGTDGLCVLANSADSTGSGSPGDATDILSELLAAELDRPALVSVVDPEAVEFAWRCGEGDEFDFPVGGKLDHVFNEPVNLLGRVTKLAEPSFRIEGTAFSGVEVRLGRSAVVERGNVSVLLTTNRPWTHDPNFYRCVGLAPERANIVVVKSPLMYRTAYASIAKRMLPVDSEGASPSQFVKLHYRYIDPTMFPFDKTRQFTPLSI